MKKITETIIFKHSDLKMVLIPILVQRKDEEQVQWKHT